MDSGHRARLLANLEQAGYEALASRLSPTDLQSLLMEVAKDRAEQVSPATLLARRKADRFVSPSSVDPRAMNLFDSVAMEVVGDRFQPVELAPICPLGTVSALTTLSQNNVVSTIRNSEVVADATNCLALEVALRRKASDAVRLCASHRVVRTQKFTGAVSFAHFRLFSMVTGGRNEGGQDFELRALQEQISCYLDILRALRTRDFSCGAAEVTLTDFERPETGRLDPIVQELARRFPSDHFAIDSERQQAKGYYHPFCFWIFVRDADGNRQNIGDGGFTDWTQRLLNNRKERLLISGFGTERFCFLFRASA